MAILSFFLWCSLFRLPLSCNKTSGGDNVAWVGVELLHRSSQLGITQRRADWFIRWSREVGSATHINTTRFEEGLGRIMYVVGALEYERPFFVPLNRFLFLLPRGSTRRVPANVSCPLRYLAQQVAEGRHHSSAADYEFIHSAPRVDAQASEGRAVVGCWLPFVGPNGALDTSRSPWFSVEVTKENCSRAYERSDTSSLLISSLEALAVLLVL